MRKMICTLCLFSLCIYLMPSDIFFCDARYVGRLFVKGSGKPMEILAKLKQMAVIASDEEIELYEVCYVKFSISYMQSHMQTCV